MIQIPGFSFCHSFQKVTGTLSHFKTIWIRGKKRRHQACVRTCQLRRIFRSTCLGNCWCKFTFIMCPSYRQHNQQGFPHRYRSTLKP